MTESLDPGSRPNGPFAQPGLNQLERVVETFVAPEKTFLDIRRSASWWVPFLLGTLVTLLFTFCVDRQIGFEKVAEANISRSPQAQERLGSLTEAQRSQTMHTIAATTKIFSYAYPVTSLIFGVVIAVILLVSFNFGLGAAATYARYLAVWFYASLPLVLKYVLAAIAISAGASSERFELQNPIGTNIGWYLSSDVPLWVRTLLSSFDLFTIWTIVLLIIGCAAVAGVKRTSAAVVVVAWWIMTIIAFTAAAGMQS